MVGIVLSIHWLVSQGKKLASESAVAFLRGRYVRKEINKEDFENKKKDLQYPLPEVPLTVWTTRPPNIPILRPFP